ncbi:metallophosphoesterase [Fulvivirga lutimaris]|uniref:metallophosphoesterase n=1 Tax=Fulvivirga lutimaris TaxID=1819566 RepID=UPI0012BC0985|nr:metallophosphoesterase [Fulvivirga lutimaris]MTI38524.1 serine/threonine protein phosphatase [Fulvivirga lutimaris]
MRRFVIGDIHGASRALLQCLERSQFDFDKDQLIMLGDVCDGYPETNQSIETLLKIKHLVFLLGNHDWWTLQWAKGEEPDNAWLQFGGQNTIKSYPDKMPSSHVALLENAPYYYEQDNKLFVHAGIDPNLAIQEQDDHTLIWDRKFIQEAIGQHMRKEDISLTGYDEVFVGHTPSHRLEHFKPVKFCEVWMMDTGAGWGEHLSIMDIDTKEVYQSDRVETLYPPGSGR